MNTVHYLKLYSVMTIKLSVGWMEKTIPWVCSAQRKLVNNKFFLYTAKLYYFM